MVVTEISGLEEFTDEKESRRRRRKIVPEIVLK